MKIAFVGCGYVFDIYMRTRWAHEELEIAGVFDRDTARSAVVAAHYGLHIYDSLESLLADERVEAVINLTSIGSHPEITRRALAAGKHVYSEKPFATDIDEAQALFALANAQTLVLTGAPCNIYSDAVASISKALRDGAIGKPVLVYAELDDNPAHLMNLETVRSPTGAPFPYAEELQEGCTVEHVGYHLVWLCAVFGPARSITAFSKALIETKTLTPLNPPDTPDFSVACLDFDNGVAARITCSWVAPRDHRFRIVGDQGEISLDNIFHDQSPVFLERFSRVSLSARKLYSARSRPSLGRVFGIGGQRIPLIRQWKSHAVETERGVGRSLKHKIVSWLRRREVYAQDKFLGIAEMARAISSNRQQPLSPEFLMHINELALLIQRAGPDGSTVKPNTTFDAFDTALLAPQASIDYRSSYRPRRSERLLASLIHALHR